MNKMSSSKSNEDDHVCPVCHDRMEVFAIGACDHPVCYRCATRMRALCNLTYCPICRADLQKILLVHRPRKFDSIETSSFCINREFMMFFEDEGISKKFYELLQHRCQICTDSRDYKDFTELRNHVQRQHQQFYCDLCVSNIQLFSIDRKYYSRTDLAKHRTQGDKDDSSYRGHPLCKFCDDRYFDNDELLRHLRKQHFFCHFCEADRVTSEYFGDYSVLKEHFRLEHFLCEEGECQEAQFVNAFRSEIDYRSHWSQRHSSGAGRQQAKQMRTIQIDFSDSHRVNRLRGGITGSGRAAEASESYRGMRDRPDSGAGNGGKQARERKDAERRRREEYDLAHALSASLASVQRQGHISVIDPFLAQHSALVASNSNAVNELPTSAQFQGRSEDFPTLDSKATVVTVKSQAMKKNPSMESARKDLSADNQQSLDQSLSDTLARKLAMSSRQSVRSGRMSDVDFPSLPSSSEDLKTKGNSWVQQSSKGKKKTLKSTWSTQGNSGAWHSDEVVEEFPQLRASKGPVTKSATAENNAVSSLSDISRSFSSGNLEVISGRPESAQANPHSWGPELNKATKNKRNELKEQDGFLRMNAKQKAKKQSAESTARNSLAVSDGKSVKKLSDLSQMLDESAKADKAHEVERGGKEKGSEKSQSKEEKSAAKNVYKQSSGKSTVDSVNANGEGAQNVSKCEDAEHTLYGKFSVLSSHPENAGKQKENAKPSSSKKTEKPSSSTMESERQGAKREKKSNRKPKEDNSPAKNKDVLKNEPTSVSGKKPVDAVNSCIEATVVEVPPQDGINSASLDGSKEEERTQTIAFTNDDFPTLVVSKTKFLPPNQKSERSTLTTLENLTNNRLPDFSNVDFPDLGSVISTSSAVAAPPGFNAPSKPPPGFGNPGPVSSKLPPGFTAFPLESSSSLTLKSRESDACVDDAIATESSKEIEYIAPRDAKERGVRLFEKIAVTLGSENLTIFRELSADFRQGRISASDYHEKCQEMIGHEKFNAVFPELVALLPDVPKQRQLFKIHRELVSSMKTSSKSTSAWSFVACDGLTSCVLCGQVLLLDDRRDHENAHCFDSEYPVLWNAIPCSVR